MGAKSLPGGVLPAEVLLSLARSRSAERRGQLALALTDLFRDGAAVLTDRERATMFDILRRLVHEVEVSVRQSIAEHLAGDAAAPRGLIQDLANDQIEVAWPILVGSCVLEDIDLIEIVQQRSLEHKLAVTQRGSVSEAVAEALVKSGEESVIVSLLRNANARLSTATMEYLVEQSQRVDAFQEPLLHRHELPPDLARRMLLWVSAALREDIVARFGLSGTAADDLLEGAVVETLETAAPSAKDAALIREIEKSGLIRPGLLREVVAAGQLVLYARVVEKLAGIGRQLALRLLFEPSGDGLAVLCRAIDVSAEDFLEIYAIARRARPFNADQLAADCRRLNDFFRSLTSDAARQVVLRWRRHPGYLAALRELQAARGNHV
ncbi:MAG TPA: DUF2336 domain-containing protein [Rhodospirillaceae bacterium]|nr:DUF2336 domain-containing protein [Rhodospirillaceae bacterium]